MIHSHLKSHALMLDERNYRVELVRNLGFDANRAFQDQDALDPYWMRRVWAGQFEKKLSAAGITPASGETVLDVCCGQGFLGEHLCTSGAAVTFTDLSSHQLSSLASRVKTNEEVAGVCESDLMRLPFRDQSFDFVVGNSFLHHIPDVPAAFHEMNRVLKWGGKLILLHEPSLSANWWETFPLSLLKDTTYNSGFTDLWQFSTADLRRMLDETAFREVTIRGSGVLGAIVCNWYLILMNKIGWNGPLVMRPAFSLRAMLSRLEMKSVGASRPDKFPSFFVCAGK